MTWTLPEPILTDTVRSPVLPPRSAAEPKWDGFRAGLCIDGGQVMLRSRRGTQMAPAFPEVVTGAADVDLTEDEFSRIEAEPATVKIHGNRTDVDTAKLADLD
ncbi:hypothetical protein ABVB69_37620 [Streptomyces sp. NPDC000349]|uniref:ATP-dependent DNA ligase n=1 Tax=Streptomyces sp. NPDC000349 TaxID=3154249 RepID=UPI00336A61C5